MDQFEINGWLRGGAIRALFNPGNIEDSVTLTAPTA